LVLGGIMPGFKQGKQGRAGNRWGSRKASNNPYTGDPTRAPDQQSTDFWGTGFGQQYAAQNPYAGIGTQAKGYRDQVMPRAGDAADTALGKFPGFGGEGGPGGSGGKWWTGGYPAAGDPRVSAHMEHIMGGQRAMMDDYAKQAANRNLRGQRVAGGGDPAAELAHQAMNTAARGYADRYDQAMGYVRDADQMQWQNAYNAWNDRANRAAGLSGQLYGYGLQSFQPQLQAAQGEAARQDNILAMQHADYRDDIDWNRGADERAFQQDMRRLQKEEAKRQHRKAIEDEQRLKRIARGDIRKIGGRYDSLRNVEYENLRKRFRGGRG
jgi:hypothetical protein